MALDSGKASSELGMREPPLPLFVHLYSISGGLAVAGRLMIRLPPSLTENTFTVLSLLSSANRGLSAKKVIIALETLLRDRYVVLLRSFS